MAAWCRRWPAAGHLLVAAVVALLLLGAAGELPEPGVDAAAAAAAAAPSPQQQVGGEGWWFKGAVTALTVSTARVSLVVALMLLGAGGGVPEAGVTAAATPGSLPKQVGSRMGPWGLSCPPNGTATAPSLEASPHCAHAAALDSRKERGTGPP